MQVSSPIQLSIMYGCDTPQRKRRGDLKKKLELLEKIEKVEKVKVSPNRGGNWNATDCVHVL